MLGQQTARRGLGGSLPFRVVALAGITLVAIAEGIYAFRQKAQTAAAPTYQTVTVATGKVQGSHSAASPSQTTVRVLENGKPVAMASQSG